MSNPLTYQSPGPDHSRTLQIATWIYLLILGILNAIVGTCLGVPALWLGAMNHTAGDLEVSFIVTAFVLFLVPAACGTAYIWSAMFIRRGSDPAAMAGLITATINAAILLAIVGFGVISFPRDRHLSVDAIIEILFPLLPFGATLAAVVLLLRLRRQWRQPSPYS